MMKRLACGRGRSAVVAALVSAGLLAGIGTGSASADVRTVSGSAFGYYVNFGLFGGPPGANGPAPTVTLPPGGGSETATDPDGAAAVYGPARIFENHGPLTVHTEGTTGAAGSSTSWSVVEDIQPNDPFTAPAPGGVSSTCTASEAGLTGSSTITNGRLVLNDPDTDVLGEPGEVVVVPPVNPAPNSEYHGIVGNVGDTFTLFFNEQLLAPDAITVNAVHFYMTGPLGIGEMIIAQSHCDVAATSRNRPPVARNDAYTTEQGTALTVPAPGVLANDTDPEGGPLSASKLVPLPPPATGGGNWTFPSDPANGTLTLDYDGSFTYTPKPGFTGTDTFTYAAQDARGRSDTATVTVTVTRPAVNAAPVAGGDAYSTGEGSVLTVGAPGVLGNDTDANTDPLTAGGASVPANGAVTLSADGSFTYTPNTGFSGTDTFTYTASDGIASSSPATVTITVIPRPVPPNDDFADAQMISGPSGSVTGSNVGATREPGEPDYPYIGGQTSIWYRWTAPTDGTFVFATCNSAFNTGLAVYTGSPVDSLSIVVSNNDSPNVCVTGGSGSSKVVLKATAGTVYSIAVDGYYGQTGAVALKWYQAAPVPNDDFADAQVLTGPSGSVTGSNVGATQEPGEPWHANQAGFQSIWYEWTAPVDGVVALETCRSDFYAVLGVYTGTSVATLTDVAPAPDASCPFVYGTSGTRVVFTAAAGTVYHIAVDGRDRESNGNVVLSWAQGRPTANNDFYSVAQDTVLTVAAPGVLGNDTDPEGDTLTAALASGPTSGTLTFSPDGSFTYTPDTGAEGTDVFTYTASDPTGNTVTATVYLSVSAQVDLAVTVAGTPDPVRVRGQLTYTVTVTNNGPNPATGVTLASTPEGTTFVSATGATCTVASGKVKAVSCQAALGDLASGASATVTIVVKAPTRPATVTNTVTVGAEQVDPDPTDNSATAQTTVIR